MASWCAHIGLGGVALYGAGVHALTPGGKLHRARFAMVLFLHLIDCLSCSFHQRTGWLERFASVEILTIDYSSSC